MSIRTRQKWELRAVLGISFEPCVMERLGANIGHIVRISCRRQPQLRNWPVTVRERHDDDRCNGMNDHLDRVPYEQYRNPSQIAFSQAVSFRSSFSRFSVNQESNIVLILARFPSSVHPGTVGRTIIYAERRRIQDPRSSHAFRPLSQQPSH